MCFYIHSEAAAPDYTLAIEWPDEARANFFDLGGQFAAAFNAANPDYLPFAANAVLFKDADGTVLPLGTAVAQLVAEGDDLFAERGTPTVPPTLVTKAAAATATATASSSSSVPSEITTLTKALMPYVKSAETAFKNRSFKKAYEVYAEVVKSIDNAGLGAVGTFPEKLVVALRRLGEIESTNDRPEKALPWLERAKRVAPADIETRVVLCDAHWKAEDAEEAIAELRGALDTIDKTKRPKKTKSLNIKLGLLLFKSGKRQEGGGLLQTILQQDQEDQEALQAYGEAALALGQAEDALKIYLRLVVAKSDDHRIKQLLAQTLKAQDGLKFLNDHLPASKSSASALAFLASTIKDFSGVKEAIQLYTECATHVPSSASYALNTMHLHELNLDYKSALASLTAHCEANPTLAVGTLSLAELLALLPADESELLASSWHLPSAGALAGEKATPKERTLPGLPAETGAESLNPDKCKPAGTYGETELDVLALAYTAVKVLYIAGCLSPLPKLISLIEPTREVKDLHLTRVRNENAYYCCTAQLVTTLPQPLPALPPLYVMGDSHSLAPAWRTVDFLGEQHLLVPRLVTGCKIWHLREASEFFPKYNFEHAVKAIPDGSPVVTIFGEIDCREGLLLAIERMRYPDLESGVAHTIKIYISTLKQLALSKKLKILVHPVPPVLNETRHIVTIFNRQLVKAVNAEPSLHMLDFFDELLTSTVSPKDAQNNMSGMALKEELKLDGTHMHPDYVKLMEAELQKVAAKN